MDYQPQKLTALGLNSTCPYAMPEEIEEIKHIARKLSGKDTAVMIGCGPAVFGLALVEDLKTPANLWIVDKIAGTFEYAEAHFSGAQLFPGVTDRIHFVEGDSPAIGREWQSDIKFLLVDGDHSYAGVKADIDAWLPHVPRKGLVWFHDYLERPGGFDGPGEWGEGGCALAVSEAIADGRLMTIKHVGISILCERLT